MVMRRLVLLALLLAVSGCASAPPAITTLQQKGMTGRPYVGVSPTGL